MSPSSALPNSHAAAGSGTADMVEGVTSTTPLKVGVFQRLFVQPERQSMTMHSDQVASDDTWSERLGAKLTVMQERSR
jgi:hypothetical protein